MLSAPRSYPVIKPVVTALFGAACVTRELATTLMSRELVLEANEHRHRPLRDL
jgi:hypothetical protein